MLADLTPAQRALAQYMSALSEAAFLAGWMDGLEHALWRAVLEGPCQYGRLMVTEEHIARLKALSAACDGWIYFHKVHEESFVPVPVWRDAMYDGSRN
jgi:hypothetical protein